VQNARPKLKLSVMRLADFILANVEPILAEWERFARGIWPGPAADPGTLRDHAEAILRATVVDMKSAQTKSQQAAKSKGEGEKTHHTDDMDTASEKHASDRAISGFELGALVAEYRALRASVPRLWRESGPTADLRDIEEVTRFNESIDESLTEAVESFSTQVERNLAALADEKAARAGAEHANLAKDAFLAMLSHELRTPLNAIVGWMSILRSKGCNAEDLDEGLEVVERNTKAQVRLIEDVLDVSSMITGKLRLDRRPCNLAGAVAAGIDAVRAKAAERQITLDVSLDPSASHGSCDATRVQQIVWNLVSNAVKFTPQGGRIGVTLSRQKSYLQIDVTDSGIGISPELLPHIFDRFRQADSSSRRKYGGLGLGLSIVKTLAEMHEGSVEVRSTGEGQGSTFTVRLPIKAVEIDEGGEDAASQADAGVTGGLDAVAAARDGDGPPLLRLDGLKVLLVDDEPDALRLLTKVLKRAGATVAAVANVADAMAAISKSVPEFLISDIGMPGEDGLDLIRKIRADGYSSIDLPAIAVTAFAHSDDRRRALLAGFQCHIPKPVDPHDLTAVIASLAGRTG